MKIFWYLGARACQYKNTMDNASMLKSVKACIPKLDGDKHKGQAGRIGIVGGSLEYTGAPYFAGISAMKVGADLVHIFCASAAASVIKSYSPELIVHPLLDRPKATTEISPWLDRLHALVIGPGLGREEETFKVVTELISIVQEKKIPLVIDADGLFLVTSKPELIKDFSSPVILTPNKIEFERLSNSLGGTTELSKLGKYVTVFKKGEVDEVYSAVPGVQWKSNQYGSNRRCGGQGDVLSGSIATFLNWTLSSKDKIEIGSADDKAWAAASLSCYAASILVRLSNERAFKTKGRSMLAGDMIEYIHESFEELYGQLSKLPWDLLLTQSDQLILVETHVWSGWSKKENGSQNPGLQLGNIINYCSNGNPSPNSKDLALPPGLLYQDKTGETMLKTRINDRRTLTHVLAI